MTRTEFYSKAELYHKYRWEYHSSAIDYILQMSNLKKNSVLLDIGAGTGKLTKHFIKYINKIYAVEPDSNMFEILEKSVPNITALKRFSNNIPEIPDNSVDVIVAAHSLHWFDYKKTIYELNRISSKDCRIFSIENQNISDNPLFQETSKLIQRYTDDKIQNKHDLKNIDNYFKDHKIQEQSFEYITEIDFNTYLGSLVSTSYLPTPNDENYYNFENEAQKLFNKYSNNLIIETKIKTFVKSGLLNKN